MSASLPLAVDDTSRAQPHYQRFSASVAPCFVRTLRLSHFRNYASLMLEAEPGPMVFTGPNGAGKTNILEALSLLAPGKGLRKARLGQLERAGAGVPWVVSATLEVDGMETHIGTGRDPEASAAEATDKRLVRIDGKPVRGQQGLAEACALLWLTPQMDGLFLAAASDRRKFFDKLVVHFDPEHLGRIAAYEHVMRERNRLLGMARHDAQWLASLERKMAEYSMSIAAARIASLERLQWAMAQAPTAFPKAEMGLEGSAEEWLLTGGSALEGEAELAARLHDARQEDAMAGRAQHGAHRTDLVVMHRPKAMAAALCSTGEQKALMLTIILAQARAVAAWRGRNPIVLLDEVVAHLDDARRRELFDELLAMGVQVWLTGTDESLFAALAPRAALFAVEEGAVNRRAHVAS